MSVVFIVMKRENILRKAKYFFLKIRDASEDKNDFVNLTYMGQILNMFI